MTKKRRYPNTVAGDMARGADDWKRNKRNRGYGRLRKSITEGAASGAKARGKSSTRSPKRAAKRAARVSLRVYPR